MYTVIPFQQSNYFGSTWPAARQMNFAYTHKSVVPTKSLLHGTADAYAKNLDLYLDPTIIWVNTFINIIQFLFFLNYKLFDPKNTIAPESDLFLDTIAQFQETPYSYPCHIASNILSTKAFYELQQNITFLDYCTKQCLINLYFVPEKLANRLNFRFTTNYHYSNIELTMFVVACGRKVNFETPTFFEHNSDSLNLPYGNIFNIIYRGYIHDWRIMLANIEVVKQILINSEAKVPLWFEVTPTVLHKQSNLWTNALTKFVKLLQQGLFDKSTFTKSNTHFHAQHYNSSLVVAGLLVDSLHFHSRGQTYWNTLLDNHLNKLVLFEQFEQSSSEQINNTRSSDISSSSDTEQPLPDYELVSLDYSNPHFELFVRGPLRGDDLQRLFVSVAGYEIKNYILYPTIYINRSAYKN